MAKPSVDADKPDGQTRPGSHEDPYIAHGGGRDFFCCITGGAGVWVIWYKYFTMIYKVQD